MSSNSSVNDAFKWLDEFFFTPTDQSSPDEAFDWIFMLAEDGWRLLEQAWENRPAVWRESCAYILGEGPVPESLPLLQRAIFDSDLNVATQAACALAGQRLNNEEQVELSAAVLARFRELVALMGGAHMDEVLDVLGERSD